MPTKSTGNRLNLVESVDLNVFFVELSCDAMAITFNLIQFNPISPRQLDRVAAVEICINQNIICNCSELKLRGQSARTWGNAKWRERAGYGGREKCIACVGLRVFICYRFYPVIRKKSLFDQKLINHTQGLLLINPIAKTSEMKKLTQPNAQRSKHW